MHTLAQDVIVSPSLRNAETLSGFLQKTRKSFGRIHRLIGNYCAVARQRRALATLNDDLLRDIGLTREQARTESNKPFWR